MDTNKKQLPAVALLLDSARGTYIPSDFVTGFDLSVWTGISEENAAICADPEHENYWDAWSDILSSAEHTDGVNTWTLYQDGDLWALCYELMTDEEKSNFGFDE